MMTISYPYSCRDQDIISFFPIKPLPLRSIFIWSRLRRNCPNGPISDPPVQIRQQGIILNLIIRCQRLKQTRVPKKDLKSPAPGKLHSRKLSRDTSLPKNPPKERE